ncbi:MAG: molecular chaperone DnaK, partial [Nitrosomonas sp.]|nr:molecular chaperone DnaK [Nitrosomonas sp.]
KSLSEFGDKLEGDEKAKIETALKEAEDALKLTDKDAIDAKTQVLTEASQKLAEKIYAQEQAAQPGAAGQAETGAGEAKTGDKPVEGEVVDAEFEEVKDKK